MAITTTYSGQLALTLLLQAAYSVDRTGGETAKHAEAITFAAAGGSAPTLSGFFKGTATCAAGDWLLAHATDPLQGMGDARYSEGFTVAGTKLKALLIANEDSTNSITITKKALAGLPIFNADGDAITIPPGGFFLFYLPAGTAALSTTVNDGLTISVSGGTPEATVVAAYGP